MYGSNKKDTQRLRNKRADAFIAHISRVVIPQYGATDRLVTYLWGNKKINRL